MGLRDVNSRVCFYVQKYSLIRPTAWSKDGQHILPLFFFNESRSLHVLVRYITVNVTLLSYVKNAMKIQGYRKRWTGFETAIT